MSKYTAKQFINLSLVTPKEDGHLPSCTDHVAEAQFFSKLGYSIIYSDVILLGVGEIPRKWRTKLGPANFSLILKLCKSYCFGTRKCRKLVWLVGGVI